MKVTTMVRFLTLIGTLFVTSSVMAYWQEGTGFSLRTADRERVVSVNKDNLRYMQADFAQLQSLLLTEDNIDVDIPLPDGGFATYHLEFDPIAEQGLLSKYPSIRTFRGVDVTHSGNRGRFDISPSGFRGMFKHNGETVFIDPQFIGNNSLYIAYAEKDADSVYRPADVVEHSTSDLAEELKERVLAKGSSDRNLRTYRLAVAVTGEYSEVFSDSTDPAVKRAAALAEVVTAINRVNDVFINDLGIRLNLVANNDQIIYVDTTTDTYANQATSAELSRNQINIDDVIGSANYDIGHLFTTDPGGIAQLSSVCNDLTKARGLSGLEDPTNDPFIISILSHEIGHQFGANHTFNGTAGSCGSNRNATTAFEPGSGSTIMSYAGICGPENLPSIDDPSMTQEESDPYFNAGSIAEITRYVTTGQYSLNGTLVNGVGDECGTVSATANNVPDAQAGPDLTVPANTPLYLVGSATDADLDTLSYVWEQLDVGAASASVADWIDNGDRALFRSVLPSANAFRYLPNLADLSLTETLDNGESLPATNRNLNFRFTVRDGNGATAFENKVLTVTTAAGPFDLISPEDDDVWTQGATIVTWDVAGTNTAPVNCATVDILYDGSIIERTDVNASSFSTILASGVANDGLQTVTTPTTATFFGRVMVRCTSGGFFTMSSEPFEVSSSSTPIVSSVSDESANEGDSMTFTVIMSAVPSTNRIVAFELSQGTAAFSDFGAVSFSGVTDNNDGTLTVPAGTVTFTATVPTIEDSANEEDETFVLSIGSASGTGTIINDDTPPSTTTGGNGNSLPEGNTGGSSGPLFLLLLSLMALVFRRMEKSS